ncbi:hypothetical protein Bca4012_020610 [Brassica carinata]
MNDGDLWYCLPLPARNLLHKKRGDNTLDQFRSDFGESCISCQVKLAGPEYKYHPNFHLLIQQWLRLFTSEQLTNADNRAQVLSDDIIKLNTFDNSLSPAHILFQLLCVDQTGLLYLIF